MRAGEYYTFSVEIMCDIPFAFYIDGNVEADNYVGNDVARESLTYYPTSYSTPGKWQRVVVTVKVKADAQNPRAHDTLAPWAPYDPAVYGRKIYYRNWQLEQKPFATSFIDGTRAAETLTIPTASVLNPQEGTVECWLFIPYGVGVYDYSRSFLGTAHSENYFLLSVTRDGKIRFASLPAVFRSSNTVQYNNWNHVALRWDSQGRTIFLNGVKTFSTGVIPAIDGNLLYIGSGVGQFQLNGLIDDLRISSRARTDAEIAAAYQSGQSLPVDAWTTLKLDFNGDLSTQSGVIP